MKTAVYNQLRTREINSMNEDDKGMHIFYTLEDIEDTIKHLHKTLRADDSNIGGKITRLENIQDELLAILKQAEFVNKLLSEPVLPGEPA
jgi:galactitol-specific phosphotransferase system IIB component